MNGAKPGAWTKYIGALAAFLAIACLQLAGMSDALAQQRPLKKVKIAVGTTVLGVTYPWLMMPLALDYWKEEGYDVDVLAVGASLQAVQQMVGGNAEFAQINAPIVIQSNVANAIPVRLVMANGIVDWAVSVAADGPIKDIRDLKGKTIGVFSLASGGIPFLKAYLRSNGIDPDTEIQLIAVGFGAPAVEALRTNRVQGLLFWASAHAIYENQGAKLRYFRSPDWKGYLDFTLVTLQKTIDSDPAMVEAIARGAAKATVFSLANPDCVRRLHWANWPATKPTGADEATLARWDMNSLRAQLDTLQSAFDTNGGKLWGSTTPEAVSRLQDFMVEAKLINKKLPAGSYLVGLPGFYEKVNKFDQAAIRAQAAACPAK